MRSNFGFVAIAISTIQIATIQSITIAKPVSNLSQIATEVSVRTMRSVPGMPIEEHVGAIVKKDHNLYSALLNIELDKGTKQIVTYDGRIYPILAINNYAGYSIVQFRSLKNYRVVAIGDSKTVGNNDEIYVSGHRSGKIFIQPNRVVLNNDRDFLYDNQQYSPQHNNELIFNNRSELIGFHSSDKWSIDDEVLWPNEYHDYPYPTRGSLLQIYYTNQWMPDVCGNYYRSKMRPLAKSYSRYHRGAAISSLDLVTRKLGLKAKGSRNPHSQSIKSEGNFAAVPNSMISFDLTGTETIAELDRAISLNPQDSISLFLRSNLKISNKDYLGALADLDRLVALQPNSSAVYYRGYLKQHHLKDFVGALADYDRLVELNPKDPKVYLNRGLLQEQDIHNFQAALADYDRLLEIERIPTSDSSPNLDRISPIYYFRARLKAEKMKDFAGALADYDRAIQGNNNNHLIYQQRAEVKAQLKDFNGALADYDFALNMKNSMVSLWGASQEIQDRNTYVIRAKIKADYLNDLAGALVDYNQAVELNPSGETYYERGMFMTTYRKDRTAAKADFQKAIELLDDLKDKDEADLELLKKIKLALSN
jgi:tetratricopeptide (TPR) repeat protein